MAAHLVLPTAQGNRADQQPVPVPASTSAFAFACAFASASASASAFAFAFAFAPASASLRLKASRAPQPDAAAEAPLSERSEFGRRAASGEEHRAPMQLHRIGECRRKRFYSRQAAHPSGRLRRSRHKVAQWFLLPRQKELAQSAALNGEAGQAFAF
jgi:hypothetical protein